MATRILAIMIAVLAVFPISCRDGGEKLSEEWLPFNEGIELAAREGKPVVIDFFTSWCRWCKVMDSETFSHPAVKEYLGKNFVAIRINAENRTEQLKYRGKAYTPVELTRSFGVRGFPSLAYLNGEGELIMVVAGFKKPEIFLPTLKYVKEGCYRNNVSLEDYIRKGECRG